MKTIGFGRCFAGGLLILTLALGVGPLRANDTSVGDDNGTLQFTLQPDVAMTQETLLLSEERIEVDYVFTNHAAHDVVTPMAFPMPAMYFGDGDHSGIEHFQLWVDGKPQPTKRQLVVTLDGRRDVSAAVAKAGWTEQELIAFLGEAKVPPKGKRKLPAEWLEGHDPEAPRLTLQEVFRWDQTFPAGKTVSIRHRYQPAVTTGVPQTARTLVEQYGKEACLDKDAMAGIRRRETEAGAAYGFLRYVLTTANNWRGPIGDFHLVIRKQQPTDVISLCFDGELKKTDATSFEFHSKDFRPTRDISLLFVRKPGD